MLPIVLNSTSPARKLLLERLGIPFTVNAPNIDESPLPNETPAALVYRLAEAKAQVHAEQFSNTLIIGCDQVIVLDGQIIGKPGSHANAIKQLKQSSGKKLISLTGLCLLNTQTNAVQIEVIPFYVYMRQLTASMIENYLNMDKPYQCAGSIKAESLGVALFERLEGDDPSALTGLPLIALVKMLEREGVLIV